MSRRPTRTVVHARAVIAVVAITFGACVARPPSRPADVVLIVIDTLRADHVSLYGYPRRTAPALEAFARDAVTYDDAISPGTWTVPSHAAVFTGRWPSFAGAERVPGDHNLAMPINDAAPTLAELLSRSQFHTAAFVANSAYVARALGFARGFDEFADWNLSTANRVEHAFRLWLPPRNDRLFVFMNILDPHEPYDPPGAYKRRFPGRVRRYGTVMTELVNGGTPVTPELQAHFVSIPCGVPSPPTPATKSNGVRTASSIICIFGSTLWVGHLRLPSLHTLEYELHRKPNAAQGFFVLLLNLVSQPVRLCLPRQNSAVARPTGGF